MKPADHAFLEDLEKKLWNVADRLRSSLDAAVYKHAVLGLIFLKYVSDSFEERREELQRQFGDPNHEYYLGGDAALAHEQLEERDYYTEENVFWVPALARWSTIKDHAKTADGTEIEITNGKKTTYKMRGLARLLDDALTEVEKENPWSTECNATSATRTSVASQTASTVGAAARAKWTRSGAPRA